MGFSEIDDMIAGAEFELEAQFDALESQADLNEVHAELDKAIADAKHSAAATPAPSRSPAGRHIVEDDPLADLKRSFDAPTSTPPASGPTERSTPPSTAIDAGPAARSDVREFLVVVCPSCARHNRLDRARLVTESPTCGACGAELVQRR